MIGFMHDGYFYCANVHKYRHASTVEYHVTILTNKVRPDIPSRIIFEEDEMGLSQISEAPVPPDFLKTVIGEIAKDRNKPN